MDKTVMMHRAMTSAGLSDMDQVDRAIRSVLLALTDVVSRDEAHDMASQLPKEYKEVVQARLKEGRPVQQMGWSQFRAHVQSELGLETPEATERVIRGVFAALKDAVSPGEMEDVAAELPLDLREPLRKA